MKNKKDFKENVYYKLTYPVNNYSMTQSGISIWYFKFVKNNDTIITTSGFIINNGIYNNRYVFHTGHNDVYEEVCLSEIIKYLPNDNIDKIIYMRKQKIKILLR